MNKAKAGGGEIVKKMMVNATTDHRGDKDAEEEKASADLDLRRQKCWEAGDLHKDVFASLSYSFLFSMFGSQQYFGRISNAFLDLGKAHRLSAVTGLASWVNGERQMADSIWIQLCLKPRCLDLLFNCSTMGSNI